MSYEKIGNSKQRASWLQLRQTGVGASEMGVILGVNPWKALLTLYAEKTGELEPEDLSDNERVFWGTKLEKLIVEVFGDRAGRSVLASGELLRSIAHPWALCTLDAWTAADGKTWPLEIKTTGAHRAEEWAEGPPELYNVQLQHQMLVTGAPRATIACLIGGQRLVWADVERDEVTINRIIRAGSEFWRRVEQRNPPEPDGSESARATLGALYPEDSGDTVQLDGSMIETFEALTAAKASKSAIEKQIREHENTFKAALKNATAGLLPNGNAVTWKLVQKAEHVVKATQYRQLRLQAAK